MPVRRFVERQRLRLRVGLDGTSRELLAEVTAQGFSAALYEVPPQGTPVKGRVWVGEQPFPFEGEVSWSHPGDPRLSFVGRIGVRFTAIPDDFFGALPSAR